MFNLFNSKATLQKENAEYRREIAELQKQLDSTVSQLSSAQSVINSLNARIKEMSEGNLDTDFCVDFQKMDAFSIERIFKDGQEYTIIGYRNPGDKLNPDGTGVRTFEIREWSLYCNRATHDRMVAEFRKVISK